jgi:hypothetical protein
MAKRTSIFISYSHSDLKWLDRLRTVLAPLKGEAIDVWDDSRIGVGQEWDNQIRVAMDASRVAILLVTPKFLASDYVQNTEIPHLLERSKRGLSALFWVPVRDSLYERTKLSRLQAAWDPKRPLAKLSDAKADQALVAIARKVADALSANPIASTVGQFDRIYPQLREVQQEMVGAQVPPLGAHAPSESIVQKGGGLSLVSPSGKVVRRLTGANFAKKLAPGELAFIRTKERTMDVLYARWNKTYPRRASANAAVQAKAKEELKTIRAQLCNELREILSFFDRLNFQLGDHYHHQREICGIY